MAVSLVHQYLAEATAYPDGTAAIVAEFQAEMERERAELERRRGTMFWPEAVDALLGELGAAS